MFVLLVCAKNDVFETPPLLPVEDPLICSFSNQRISKLPTTAQIQPETLSGIHTQK
jgi:hypothetical protein